MCENMADETAGDLTERARKCWEKLFAAARSTERSAEEAEELVEKCTELFRPFNLEKNTQSNFEAYFRYLLMDTKPEEPIPFNYKIHASFEAKFIVRTFLKALETITGEQQRHVWAPEEELLAHPQDYLAQLGDAPLFVIGDCPERELTAEERKAWDGLMEAFETTPGIVKFLCAEDEVLEQRFRRNKHLYNRVFRYNIFLHDDARVGSVAKEASTEVQGIMEEFFEKLSGRGFSVTSGFREDMQEYITAIFPTAELKEDPEKFIDDLLARVAMNYYREARVRQQMDESCVPYFKKKRMSGD